MNLQLVNEHPANNLGNAVIYETLAQFGGSRPVFSTLSASERLHVRGVVNGMPPLGQPCIHISVGGDVFRNGRLGW